MTGLSAVLADLFILGVAGFVLASVISEVRRRKTAGAIVVLMFVGLVALVLGVRFCGKFYYVLWLRTLEPHDVASITIGSNEVSGSEEKGKMVSALNRSTWYFRSGNLDRPKSLVILLQSGEYTSWNVNYDRKHGGAAISLSANRGGLHFGWVFSPTLAEAAADLGISIPDKPSTR